MKKLSKSKKILSLSETEEMTTFSLLASNNSVAWGRAKLRRMKSRRRRQMIDSQDCKNLLKALLLDEQFDLILVNYYN
jgi:hypothetical protein